MYDYRLIVLVRRDDGDIPSASRKLACNRTRLSKMYEWEGKYKTDHVTDMSHYPKPEAESSV